MRKNIVSFTTLTIMLISLLYIPRLIEGYYIKQRILYYSICAIGGMGFFYIGHTIMKCNDLFKQQQFVIIMSVILPIDLLLIIEVISEQSHNISICLFLVVAISFISIIVCNYTNISKTYLQIINAIKKKVKSDYLIIVLLLTFGIVASYGFKYMVRGDSAIIVRMFSGKTIYDMFMQYKGGVYGQHLNIAYALPATILNWLLWCSSIFTASA